MSDYYEMQIGDLKDELAHMTSCYDIARDMYLGLEEENKKLRDGLEGLIGVFDFCETILEDQHEVANWHLNGDTEPVMNFWEDNGADWDNMQKARKIIDRGNNE